jgi:hypothetical protein
MKNFFDYTNDEIVAVCRQEAKTGTVEEIQQRIAKALRYPFSPHGISIALTHKMGGRRVMGTLIGPNRQSLNF